MLESPETRDRMSIVFIGTPAFAVPSLRRVVADGHAVTAVITQPDRPAGRGRRPSAPPVKLAAAELGLPVLQPQSLRDPGALAQVAALQPAVILAVAYGQILRKEFLDIPPRGVLNVHPSLLPRWRGASPIASAILAGDEQTGVTIMLMDAGMDTGPILAQERDAIGPADTTGSLTDRLSALGAELLSRTLRGRLAGEIEPQPQDEARATTCRLIRKQDGAIDWSAPAIDIWRQVRAYNPWPGAYTALEGEPLHIWEAWPVGAESGEPAGAVVALTAEQRRALPAGSDPGAFAVQTGRGLLAVLRIQRAGRRALAPGDFLRGMPGLLGRRLVSSPAGQAKA
ncbi:MAG: methionyl-tRNA formyltransferase [Dehalococcoidia bacterium]|nr:methionyl-tRNA formyltransferase [Dehalococcoidia bacterium]